MVSFSTFPTSTKTSKSLSDWVSFTHSSTRDNSYSEFSNKYLETFSQNLFTNRYNYADVNYNDILTLVNKETPESEFSLSSDFIERYFLKQSWLAKAQYALSRVVEHLDFESKIDTQHKCNLLMLFINIVNSFEMASTPFPIPFIAPIEGGYLQLEWENNTKYLEFEFDSPSTFKILKTEGDLEDFGKSSIDEMNQIRDLVNWFIE